MGDNGLSLRFHYDSMTKYLFSRALPASNFANSATLKGDKSGYSA
jgi:hypothetical protein